MSDFKGIKAKDVNAYNLDQRFGDNNKKFLERIEKIELQKYSHINLSSIIQFLTVIDTSYRPKVKNPKKYIDNIDDKKILETYIDHYGVVKKNIPIISAQYDKYSNEIIRLLQNLSDKIKEYINYFNANTSFTTKKHGSIFTIWDSHADTFGWTVDIEWLASKKKFSDLYEAIILVSKKLQDKKYDGLPYENYIIDYKVNWKALPKAPWGAVEHQKTIGPNLEKINYYGKPIGFYYPVSPHYYLALLIEFEENWLEIIRNRLRIISRNEHLKTTDMYIYVLSNKAIPNLYKIGWTSGLPEDRADELTTTGVPHPYKVEYSKKFKNAVQIEKQCHDHFKKNRVANNREFFEVPINEIKDYIDSIK